MHIWAVFLYVPSLTLWASQRNICFPLKIFTRRCLVLNSAGSYVPCRLSLCPRGKWVLGSRVKDKAHWVKIRTVYLSTTKTERTIIITLTEWCAMHCSPLQLSHETNLNTTPQIETAWDQYGIKNPIGWFGLVPWLWKLTLSLPNPVQVLRILINHQRSLLLINLFHKYSTDLWYCAK